MSALLEYLTLKSAIQDRCSVNSVISNVSAVFDKEAAFHLLSNFMLTIL